MQSKGVSNADMAEAPRIHLWHLIRPHQRDVQTAALEQLGMDPFGALAVRKNNTLVNMSVTWQVEAPPSLSFYNVVLPSAIVSLNLHLVVYAVCATK